MFIKELKDSYELVLCKMSGKPMGTIFYENLTSISRGIEKVSELSFTVNRYYGVEGDVNPLYDELKNERFIVLDDTETYVIKNIREENETIKTITAYSKEKKMYKNEVKFEDICLTLKTKVEDLENSYTLDELLYQQIGWHLGHVSDKVLYKANTTITDILSDNEITLTNEEKLRYQESVDTNWYDYIMNDIADQFECYPIFDSYNKLVHLYDEQELGDNLNLILSYDNYLKTNEITTDTEDIVTRLTLVGNEDLSVIGCNPTGLPYIEDFSYFMESGEMTQELIDALTLYNIMTEKRTEQWNIVRNLKAEKNTIFTEKQKQLLLVYSMIQSLETAITMTESDSYEASLIEQMTAQIDQRALLEKDIDALYEEIRLLDEEISNLNKLCKKEFATDDNGSLIFNAELLDELKEFIYQDTYSNDAITNELDLMRLGKKKIKELKHPTKTWSVDSVNFVEKLIDNEFRSQWNGQIGLGDMILLKSDNSIECIYLVGYTQNFKEKTLQLELSNKKSNKEFSLTIGERLTQAKEAYEGLKNNKHVFSSIKFNRLGVNYDKINKEFL